MITCPYCKKQTWLKYAGLCGDVKYFWLMCCQRTIQEGKIKEPEHGKRI
jgi:hypothetical protein